MTESIRTGLRRDWKRESTSSRNPKPGTTRLKDSYGQGVWGRTCWGGGTMKGAVTAGYLVAELETLEGLVNRKRDSGGGR